MEWQDQRRQRLLVEVELLAEVAEELHVLPEPVSADEVLGIFKDYKEVEA